MVSSSELENARSPARRLASQQLHLLSAGLRKACRLKVDRSQLPTCSAQARAMGLAMVVGQTSVEGRPVPGRTGTANGRLSDRSGRTSISRLPTCILEQIKGSSRSCATATRRVPMLRWACCWATQNAASIPSSTPASIAGSIPFWRAIPPIGSCRGR